MQKNKITYYLSPYLTLCAVTERPFPMNPASNDIYMKTGDMARFKTSLTKNRSCAELWNLWRITAVSPDFSALYR